MLTTVPTHLHVRRQAEAESDSLVQQGQAKEWQGYLHTGIVQISAGEQKQSPAH